MENTYASGDSDTKHKRRIIVLFAVNPDRRIITTREVDPQQPEAGDNESRGSLCTSS